MPTIPHKIERSAVFLYGLHPTTHKWTVVGTGCIIRVQGSRLPHFYAVTNWHVASKAGSIRLNLISGQCERVDHDPSDWYLWRECDLAVLDITAHLMTGKYLVSSIPIDQFVSQFAVERGELAMGDDVFMVGLFGQHLHDDRNTPIARFGNLSRPMDNDFPIQLEGAGKIPAHLIDMRSRAGFSGSPVWVYRTPATDLTEFSGDGPPEPVDTSLADFVRSNRGMGRTGHIPYSDRWALRVNGTNLFLRFLGVHCNQFYEPFEVEVQEAIGDPVKVGQKQLYPSSVTLVIPAHRIIEALNVSQFQETRIAREEASEKTQEFLNMPADGKENPL